MPRHLVTLALAGWLLGAGSVARAAAPAGTETAPPAAPPARPSDHPAGVAAFSALPRFVGASLSPKGTTLALLSLEKGRVTLVLLDLASRRLSTVRPGGESMIGNVHWVNDERIVAELVDQTGLLAQPQPTGELYAVNADGSGGTRIFGYRAGRAGEGASRVQRARPEAKAGVVISRLPREDRKVLVSAVDLVEQDDQRTRVFKVDAYSGATSYVTEGPAPGLSYLADADGEPRLATMLDAGVRRRAFLRDDKAGWVDLAGRPGFAPEPNVLAYQGGERAVEVLEPVPGGFGVFSVSVDTGERRLLARTEIATPRRFLREPGTGRLLAVESMPDLPTIEYVDPTHPLCQVLSGLEAAYPGQHLWPVSVTDDGRLAVVSASSDRHPGRWLLVDVARRSAEPILESRPWIDPEAMAETSAFHVAASDGLRIHGYLTSPRGLAAGALPPMVVLPHGGPHWVRDEWGFNPEVQLLASRGFAVLQVNFRGSGGYGDDYQKAGYGRWGTRVMEDVVDATRWAVRKGKADPGRICLYGGSFGGYTALQAPLVAPGLFRCTVGFAGVYDLTLMAKSGDISWSRFGRGFVKTAVGEDRAALEAQSPLHQAARLELPILLIHGERDVRVPIEHAEKLRAALTRLGRPPGWLVEAQEGHGFYDEARRERMYHRLLAFLEEQTAGKGP